MGMDITNYVELRDRKTGEWKIAPVQVETVHYEAEHMDKPCCLTKVVYEYDYSQPWYGRNSELFSILDGEHSNSIIYGTRGLPVDISAEVYDKHEEFKRENGDDYWCFGETWYTLAELEAAMSNKKKYPKWDKWRDESGRKYKEVGVGQYLRDYVGAIQNFVNLCGYYNSADVRVIMWWDA